MIERFSVFAFCEISVELNIFVKVFVESRVFN